MNKQLTKTTISTALALTLVACGGSDTDVAGIGGSGYISSGSITGFGSVYVNGVKFETDSATFDVDGASGMQDDLAIGMVVKVNGSINADGVTGTASSISFDDELQGPVSAVSIPDPDGVKRSLTILGVTVIVDSSSTTFDVSGDVTLPLNTSFDFDTIQEDNNVEVSGFFNTNGEIQATRVELKDIEFDPGSIVEIEGTILNLSGTTFNLSGVIVKASSATLDDLPNGLVNDQLVEVKGTFDTTTNTVTATKVEAEDDSADDTDEFELEGIITNYVSESNFKIGGIQVDASNATREPSTLTLENDAHVEVEGAIVNGVLIATEVESEDGDIKIHAEVTAVDPATNTFEVSPVSGQSITITVSTSTQFEDGVDENKFFNINDLLVTDFVEIEGFDDGNGGISATEVDVKEQSDVILQGYATTATGDATSGSLIVLGVEFNYDIDTDFENENDFNLSPTEITGLINSISPTTPRLIKIKDNAFSTGGNTVGTADEIDIESP